MITLHRDRLSTLQFKDRKNYKQALYLVQVSYIYSTIFNRGPTKNPVNWEI